MVLPGLLGGTVLVLGILSRNYMITGMSRVLGAFLWSVEFPTFTARIAEEEQERFGAVLATAQMLTVGATAAGIAIMGVLVEAVQTTNMWTVMLLPATGFVAVGLCGLLWTLHYASHSNKE